MWSPEVPKSLWFSGIIKNMKFRPLIALKSVLKFSMPSTGADYLQCYSHFYISLIRIFIYLRLKKYNILMIIQLHQDFLRFHLQSILVHLSNKMLAASNLFSWYSIVVWLKRWPNRYLVFTKFLLYS